MNQGGSQPGSVRAPRLLQEYLLGLDHVRTRLLQSRDLHVGPGAFVGVLNKGRT